MSQDTGADSGRRPRHDLVEEASELVAAARDSDVTLKILGGVAVRLHAHEGHPELVREFKDIDVVARPEESKAVHAMLERMGYVGEEMFNTLNAGRRGLYFDLANERRLDVFMGDFEMCHKIPIMERLSLDESTLPLAELLLTKLQVVELNRRDEIDILLLLLEHDVGPHDADTINSDRIAGLCARDWGLWRTLKMNVERIRAAIGGYGFTDEQRDRVLARLEALWARIEAEPKSGKWKLRDRVGDRKRWYEKPEETD
jgi:hypothetical protein